MTSALYLLTWRISGWNQACRLSVESTCFGASPETQGKPRWISRARSTVTKKIHISAFPSKGSLGVEGKEPCGWAPNPPDTHKTSPNSRLLAKREEKKPGATAIAGGCCPIRRPRRIERFLRSSRPLVSARASEPDPPLGSLGSAQAHRRRGLCGFPFWSGRLEGARKIIKQHDEMKKKWIKESQIQVGKMDQRQSNKTMTCYMK